MARDRPRGPAGWSRPASGEAARRGWAAPLAKGSRRSFSGDLLVGFDQLEQSAAEGLGVEKSHFVSARAGAGDLVEQGHAAGVEALQYLVDVFHTQRQVVQSVAALLEKLFQAGVAARADQLQGRSVGKIEEGRVDFLRVDIFAVGDFVAEDVFDQCDRRIDVAHADGGVIEPRGGGSRGRGAATS